MKHVLLVKEENDSAPQLTTAFGRLEVTPRVKSAGTVTAGFLEQLEADLVVLVWSKDAVREEIELLRQVHRCHPDLPILVLSAQQGGARLADSFGATDYLTAPCSSEEIEDAISSLLVQQEDEDPRLGSMAERFVGNSRLATAVRRELLRLADVPGVDVLLVGETGTGKDVSAHLLHELGPLSKLPFLAVNCAAVRPSLAGSELFGHERGAFTSATARHTGAFERVGKGTLFLDEIQTLPLEVQGTLLRVVETRKFRRVGGEEPLSFSGRLICACNESFDTLLEEGEFRQDLYQRVSRESVSLPPLRDRREDIPALISFFLERDRTTERLTVDPSVTTLLVDYDYPGNVRELRNFVEAAARRCTGSRIAFRHLTPEIRAKLAGADSSEEIRAERRYEFGDLLPLAHKEAVSQLESEFNRVYLPRLLEECGNNCSRAADRAGLDPKTFRRKWEDAGLGKLSTR